MTDQYQQNNINSPRGSRPVVADTQLNLDDDLVPVSTTGGAVTVTLPSAPQIPGERIVVKATNAGSTGNPVTVDTIGSQTIDGASSVTLTEDEQSSEFASDGINWRLIGSANAAAAGNPPLTLVFEAPTTVAPYIFGTWAEVLTAVGVIPVAASGDRTPFDLYITDSPSAGSHDLQGCSLQGFTPESGSTNRTTIIVDSTWDITGCARFSNFSFGSAAPLSATIFPTAASSVTLENVSTSQPANGGPTDPYFAPTSFTASYTLQDCALGSASIDIGAAFTFTLNVKGNTRIVATGISDFGGSGTTATINILDSEASVSLSQAPTVIDLNIGDGAGISPSHGGGAEWMFSCGDTDFGAILAGSGSASLYPGGTFAGPATAFAVAPSPQDPPLGAPVRGFVTPRDCYIKGIGVEIPTTGIADGFSIEVYVAGALVLTEGTGTFLASSVSQFDATVFAAASEGDLIQVVLVPDAGTTATLTSGMIVTVRAS